MSSPLCPRGTEAAGTVCRAASSDNCAAATTSSGSWIADAPFPGAPDRGPDVVEAVGLDEAVPYLATIGRDQREGHRAADE